MARRAVIQRADVAALPAIDDARAGEMRELAQELAHTFQKMTVAYREKLGYEPDAIDTQLLHNPEVHAGPRARICNDPPDQISWWDFTLVTEHAPEVAQELWDRLKADARQELQTGMRAARMIEDESRGRPLDRARFLVLREALVDSWQPRDGRETLLVDQLAQAETLYEQAMQRFVMLTGNQSSRNEFQVEKQGTWEPPHVYTADWIATALEQAVQFQKMTIRLQRLLRDLRRGPAALILAPQGQVNVATQQVNQLVRSDAPPQETTP